MNKQSPAVGQSVPPSGTIMTQKHIVKQPQSTNGSEPQTRCPYCLRHCNWNDYLRDLVEQEHREVDQITTALDEFYW